jgi:hypothetical protein
MCLKIFECFSIFALFTKKTPAGLKQVSRFDYTIKIVGAVIEE